MRVLAVGVATLDIVNRVAAYPKEDQELRASAQQIRRGGNACNTLTVLSRLGHEACWAGMLADDAASELIRRDLAASRVDTQWARVHPGGVTPTSYITSSQATGSRTIVHYRELPEYDDGHFSEVDLRPFDWLHFEGRNPQATEVMLKRARQADTGAQISLELEKPRAGLEGCLAYADVVMISRAYALSKACRDAERLFEMVRPMAGSALLYLAWGDQGAWLQTGDGDSRFMPAFEPSRVVDTLGAGDVFNAGVIHSLHQGDGPREALAYAIRIAGEKCAREGL